MLGWWFGGTKKVPPPAPEIRKVKRPGSPVFVEKPRLSILDLDPCKAAAADRTAKPWFKVASEPFAYLLYRQKKRSTSTSTTSTSAAATDDKDSVAQSSTMDDGHDDNQAKGVATVIRPTGAGFLRICKPQEPPRTHTANNTPYTLTCTFNTVPVPLFPGYHTTHTHTTATQHDRLLYHTSTHHITHVTRVKPRGLVGMVNPYQQNRCYMHAIIQSLLTIPELRNYFLVKTFSPKTQKLAHALQVLMTQMNGMKNGSVVDTKVFKSKLAEPFDGMEQQDAGEFLLYLLRVIGEELNRATEEDRKLLKRMIDEDNKMPTVTYEGFDVRRVTGLADGAWRLNDMGERSVVTDLFRGQSRLSSQCLECKRFSYKFDVWTDIALPLPQGTQAWTTLDKCFSHYTRTEIVERCCPYCKATRCEQQASIQRFPPVLMVWFKRFTESRTKLNTQVFCPREDLDLKSYATEAFECTSTCATAPVYDLCAVTNHMGTTRGGHYTADCLTGNSPKWFNFNDSVVAPTAAFKPDQAYLLFYRQRGT